MRKKKKNFVVLGCGVSQISFIKYLQSLKYTVIGFDIDPYAKSKKLVDHFYQLSILDYEKIISVISADFRGEIAGCFTYASVGGVFSSLAKVCEAYDLSYQKIINKSALEDKNVFYQIINSCHENSAASYMVNDYKGAKEKSNGFGSFVIKPSSGGHGANGVFVVKEGECIEEKFSVSQSLSFDEAVLVQEYVVGEEFSIDGYIFNNDVNIICITKKCFIEDGGVKKIRSFEYSSAYKFIADEALQVIKCFARRVGLNDSLFSFDLIYREEKLYFIDFGLLLDSCIHLWLESAGFDINRLFIKLALGDEGLTVSNRDLEAAHINFYYPGFDKLDFNSMLQEPFFINHQPAETISNNLLGPRDIICEIKKKDETIRMVV